MRWCKGQVVRRGYCRYRMRQRLPGVRGSRMKWVGFSWGRHPRWGHGWQRVSAAQDRVGEQRGEACEWLYITLWERVTSRVGGTLPARMARTVQGGAEQMP